MTDIAVSEVTSNAAIIHHSKLHAARAPEQTFFIELQVEGHSAVAQEGREARLAPGDFTLCDTTRPYEVTFERPVSMLIVSVPLTRLRRFVGYPEAITAVRVPGSSGLGGLASVLLRNVWNELRQAGDVSIEANVCEAILHVIACAYATLPRACANRGSLATARRLRIVREIEENLCDPELTPARIAERCNISVRYAHRLFAVEGETIGQYVLRRRLEIASQMLSNPTQGGRSITAIATDVGFGSLAQFCNVFRERFAMSPGDYRSLRHSSEEGTPLSRTTRRRIW